MTRQYVQRSNQSHRKSDDSWILQRTAVRSIPVTTPQVQTEPQADDQPRLKMDLMQIPVRNHERPVVQHDRYGPEGDRMATREVQNLGETVGRSPLFPAQFPYSYPVQPIQAKLTIGQPNDKYEQEADRVAAMVVQQINAPGNEQSIQEESVKRKSEKVQRKISIQGADAIASGEATQEFTSALETARGGGQPLDAGLQQSMGQAMGADFSGVRVHTDARSDQLNQSIQARAFTTGKDIFFRQGEYNPASRGRQELIAHELTHVVQQSSGDVQISRMPIEQKHDGINKSSENYKNIENDLREKLRYLKLERENKGDFYTQLYEDYNLEEDATYYGNLIKELKKKEQQQKETNEEENNEELLLLREELDRIRASIEEKSLSYRELLNRQHEVQGLDPFEQAEERKAEELRRNHEELNMELKAIKRTGRQKEIKPQWERTKQRYAEARRAIRDRYNSLDLQIDPRKFLENKGIMLLPSNMPLAGIFPSGESKNYNMSNKACRYQELVNHAEQLVKRYRLYNKKNGGILRNENEGCVCIMYIKEGALKQENGASYRPAFGISGLKPSGGGQAIPQERALAGMGVPGDTTADFDARVDKLRIDLERREKMNIKIPSVQAVLTYLQFPFDDRIERWSPVQCAEPRIVMAVYRLYHRPADLALSVPFEHGLKDGQILGKYTCSRCAISESKFAAPKEGGGREIVNMGLRANYLWSGDLEPTEEIKKALGRVILTRKG